jgi:uncharacterized protein
MFGLSLSKVLLTAIAIAIVWYGCKWMNRMQARRRAELDEAGRPTVGERRAGRAGRRTRRAATEDLVQCAVCESYVPAHGGGPCDRSDCPFSR